MVVDNLTFGIGILIVFTYAVVYRNNKFIGNVMFIAEGLAMALVGTTTTYMVGVGFLFTAGAVINTIIDAFNTRKKQTTDSELSRW